MKRTKNNIGVFSLGMITTLACAGVDGDPRVQVVEFPNQESDQTSRLAFSDDGSTIVIQQNEFSDQRILVHRDGVWELVLDYSLMDRNGVPQIAGVSADGSVFAITDSTGSFVSRDGVVNEIPNVWVDDSGQAVLDGVVYVRTVSRDGATLGLLGSSSTVHGSDALVWNDAHGMMNLNIGFTGDDASHQILTMNPDASVIAGSSSFYGQMNNTRNFLGFHESWVVSDQGLQMIPHLELGYDVISKVRDVSNDGRTVIGTSGGYWLIDTPLNYFNGVSIEFGPGRSWIWTPEHGTQRIMAPSRYKQVLVYDVSGNGQTVFGYGYGPNISEQFLWTRKGGFITIQDLLIERGIEIGVDYFHLESLSDDGLVLMGWGYENGTDRRSAVIIDISE